MSYTVLQPDLDRDRASILDLWKRNLPAASADRYAWLYETGLAIHKEQIQEEGLAEIWARVLQFFESQGVTEFAVINLLGKQSFADVRAEDIANLRHLVQSIRAGFQSVAEVFQMPDNASPAVGEVGGAVSAEREED